jgi:uncharacterized short protein YbdD (DUF466 family)
VSAPAGAVASHPGLGPVRRALAGVWWYLRELSGEAKWDDYLERCALEGVTPMSRRQFERHRDQHREGSTQSRCC